MSLNAAAQHLADYGRQGDTTLVHMTPDEVRGLQQLAQANGTSLTINPHTGLPEAFGLKDLVKVAAPIALGAFLGPAGAAYGGGFFSAAGAGMAVGGLETLRTGSLEKGLMAGLSAYGAADMSTAAVDAAAKEEAAKQVATQNSYVTNELAAQKAAETSATSGAVQASATPGIQGAQTAELANEANMMTMGNEGQLANANAYNAQIDPIGRIASTYSTPASGAETLFNNPGAVAKEMGGYGSMAKSGLMAAAPALLGEGPKGPDAPPIPERYITPKYYDYRTQTYYDLPSVNTKDWGDKTIEGYRNSMVSKPVRAADGGMMGSGTPYDAQDLAYQNDPVVRMADGGATPQTLDQMYQNVLGRSADEGGAKYWAQQFGDTIDENEAAAFRNAAAPELKTSISNIYQNTLGRDADTAGVDYWTQQAQSGANLSDVYGNMLAAAKQNQELVQPGESLSQAISPYSGYKSPVANSSVDEWVRNTLGREATEKEKQSDWYQQALAGAATPEQSQGIYGQFQNYAKDTGTTEFASKLAQARQIMAEKGLTDNDVYTQTGKTVEELIGSPQTSLDLAQASQLRSPTSSAFDFDALQAKKQAVMTTPRTNAPVGTTNPYGNTTNPGDITVNADKTRTVTPNIPGRPYGGFSGMEQVRDAYTAGGGKLGQVLSPTKSYTNTGGSASAYDYLFGKGAWPTQQQKQPVYKDTAGNTTQKYIWRDNLMVENPDYVDPTKKKADEVVTKTDVLEAAGSGAANGGLMAAYAAGGQTQYNLGGYSDGGRLLRGPGDGVSDSIPATIGGKQPARLADGEFVIPARIVSEIGNGSTEAGARKLYAMMDRVQKARGKTVGKGKVAKNTRADKHLPA